MEVTKRCELVLVNVKLAREQADITCQKSSFWRLMSGTQDAPAVGQARDCHQAAAGQANALAPDRLLL